MVDYQMYKILTFNSDSFIHVTEQFNIPPLSIVPVHGVHVIAQLSNNNTCTLFNLSHYIIDLHIYPGPKCMNMSFKVSIIAI